MPGRTQRFARVLVIAAIASVLPLAAADERKQRVNNEAEIRHTIQLDPQPASRSCKAQLELEYCQKGAEVHVDKRLRNAACAASSGSYVIEVRYRGGDGELKSKSFAETWKRDDDQPVTTSSDYAIEANVDVVRVRSRKLRCECTEPAAGE